MLLSRLGPKVILHPYIWVSPLEGTNHVSWLTPEYSIRCLQRLCPKGNIDEITPYLAPLSGEPATLSDLYFSYCSHATFKSMQHILLGSFTETPL